LRRLAVFWFTFILLTGCLSQRDASDRTDALPPIESRHELPSLLLERSNVGPEGLGAEADLQCRLGGSGELTRDKAGHVSPGASHVVFELEMTPTYTGFQFGYRVAPEEELTWLPVLRQSGEQRVEVRPGQHEETEHKWAFAYRMNVEPEQDCYTGGGAGQLSFRILAVRD
jgi:hypothetical protein